MKVVLSREVKADDDVLVFASAAGSRRHGALASDPLRALCGAKTSGWQITHLVLGGHVDCLRCVHRLRRSKLLSVVKPELRGVPIFASVAHG